MIEFKLLVSFLNRHFGFEVVKTFRGCSKELLC